VFFWWVYPEKKHRVFLGIYPGVRTLVGIEYEATSNIKDSVGWNQTAA